MKINHKKNYVHNIKQSKLIMIIPKKMYKKMNIILSFII